NVIAAHHASQGEWQAALTNFAISVKVDPTNYFAYHYYLPILVQTGDLEGYELHRKQALLQFGKTSDPETADRIAKVCLMLPPAPADLPTLEAMADTALKAGPQDKKWPYYEFLKGLAEYRQGHFDAALEWMQKFLPPEGQPRDGVRTLPATVVAA